MKVVYIAGKFRGPTSWHVEKNVRRAEEAALSVAEAGAMPLCPHTMTRHFHGLLNDQFWLDGTMELLRRCDAVFLARGWEGSVGTALELGEARDLGKPVFVEIEKLSQWLAQFQ